MRETLTGKGAKSLRPFAQKGGRLRNGLMSLRNWFLEGTLREEHRGPGGDSLKGER